MSFFASAAGRLRAMPLKMKAKAVGALSFCLLFVISFSCTASLAYYNYSFKRLFDTSYLQSDAMTAIWGARLPDMRSPRIRRRGG